MERGALTEAVYYILLSLYRPMHGYLIMQNIANISEGRVSIGAGTLYGAINTLLYKNWVVLHNADNNKKEYLITELGKKAVEAEIIRLEKLFKTGKEITGGK